MEAFVVTLGMFMLAGSAIATIWLVIALFAVHRRASPDACPGCGYPKRGLAGDTCPECGHRLSDPHVPRRLSAYVELLVLPLLLISVPALFGLAMMALVVLRGAP